MRTRPDCRWLLYTFKDERIYLAQDYRGDPHVEYHWHFQLAVDAMFSDIADTAVAGLASATTPTQ